MSKKHSTESVLKLVKERLDEVFSKAKFLKLKDVINSEVSKEEFEELINFIENIYGSLITLKIEKDTFIFNITKSKKKYKDIIDIVRVLSQYRYDEIKDFKILKGENEIDKNKIYTIIHKIFYSKNSEDLQKYLRKYTLKTKLLLQLFAYLFDIETYLGKIYTLSEIENIILHDLMHIYSLEYLEEPEIFHEAIDRILNAEISFWKNIWCFVHKGFKTRKGFLLSKKLPEGMLFYILKDEIQTTQETEEKETEEIKGEGEDE